MHNQFLHKVEYSGNQFNKSLLLDPVNSSKQLTNSGRNVVHCVLTDVRKNRENPLTAQISSHSIITDFKVSSEPAEGSESDLSVDTCV